MMPDRAATDRHIRRETLVSVVINTLLSLAFFILVFGLGGPVDMWGAGNWVFDFIPQSFMVAFMSVMVPGILSQRKSSAGTLAPLPNNSRLPERLVFRALLLAVSSVIIGGTVVAMSVAIAGVLALAYPAALTLKLIYGAGLAAIVTPVGLRAALSANHSFTGGKTS